MNGSSPYNRKLFLRVKYGYYIFNPDLKIKLNEQWINIYALLGLESIRDESLAAMALRKPYEALKNNAKVMSDEREF